MVGGLILLLMLTERFLSFFFALHFKWSKMISSGSNPSLKHRFTSQVQPKCLSTLVASVHPAALIGSLIQSEHHWRLVAVWARAPVNRKVSLVHPRSKKSHTYELGEIKTCVR